MLMIWKILKHFCQSVFEMNMCNSTDYFRIDSTRFLASAVSSLILSNAPAFTSCIHLFCGKYSSGSNQHFWKFFSHQTDGLFCCRFTESYFCTWKSPFYKRLGKRHCIRRQSKLIVRLRMPSQPTILSAHRMPCIFIWSITGKEYSLAKNFKSNARETWCVILVSVS